MMPQILSIIHVTFAPQERGKAYGVYGGIAGCASAVGLIVGGLLVQWNLFGLQWRPVFLVNVPVGLAAVIVGWFVINEAASPNRRRLDLAQAALLAHRRRFPSSARAAEAIFLLGRVAELQVAGRANALMRYDEYLARAPNGTYAAEALGRKMTLLNDIGGAAKARPIAEAYLRRFPDGSYAGAARALLSVTE